MNLPIDQDERRVSRDRLLKRLAKVALFVILVVWAFVFLGYTTTIGIVVLALFVFYHVYLRFHLWEEREADGSDQDADKSGDYTGRHSPNR